MKSTLVAHFVAEKKELLSTFTTEHLRLVIAWEEDDAGVDLESFFDEDNRPDEEVLEKLQFLIGAIGEVQFLEERAQKLDKIEKALGVLVDALKE